MKFLQTMKVFNYRLSPSSFSEAILFWENTKPEDLTLRKNALSPINIQAIDIHIITGRVPPRRGV
jgi:hypothetical protein